MKAVLFFFSNGELHPTMTPWLGLRPRPRHNMPCENWENKNEKYWSLEDRFKVKVSIPKTAVFSKSNFTIKKSKNQLLREDITCNHLNKFVCKIRYESANKCGTHKHLSAYIVWMILFQRPKLGEKLKKKRWETDCGMK